MAKRFARICESLSRSAVRLLRHWIVPLAVVFAILAPIRAALADWYDVPTGSMKPTIVEGDRIFVQNCAFGIRVPMTTRWLARWDEPNRGDIVTLASPRDGIRLVKRVVGLPGDRISMRSNRLHVNGRPIEYELVDPDAMEVLPDGREARVTIHEEALPGRDHAVAFTPGAPSARTFREVVVPLDHYFVMGDNRDQSLDSRVFGPVPLESIYGRSSHVVLSLDRKRGLQPRFERWMRRLR